MNDRVSKPYEVAFLAKNENGAASVIKNITESGGEILGEGELGHMKLSYPIKGHESAYFGCIQANIPTQAVAEIGASLRLDDGIVRFLFLSPPPDSSRKETSPRQETSAPRREEKPKATAKPQPETALSNELLEEKLEEILK